MRRSSTIGWKGTALATASIPPPKLKPLLDDDYAFLICIAADTWPGLTAAQRTAVVDHELCHCVVDSDGPTTIGHDYEEFAAIIERHGLWRGTPTEKAIQTAFVGQGIKVGTLKD